MRAGSSTSTKSNSRHLRAHLATPLYRNAYLLILGAGATSLLGFLFWALAARRYSAEVVGLNTAVISAMMLVSGACQLGLSSILIRYLPRAGHATRRLVVSSYVLAGTLSAVVALVMALTSASWSPSLAFLGNQGRWLAGFAIATTAWTIFCLQDAVMAGMRQAQWVTIENSLFSAAKIALLVAFVSAAPFSGIFLAWNVPMLIAVVAVNLLIFLRLVPRHVQSTVAEVVDTRRMVRFASGNYLGSLFMLASTLVLPILVTNESGARATAYFFIPWGIATAVQLVVVNMDTSLTVEVAFDQSKLRDYCRRIIVQTMLLIVPITLILLAGAPYILRAFGPSYASEGATLLRLLAVASIPSVIVALGLSVARIQQKGRAVLWVQAVQCFLTLGLTYLLLPRVGIDGVGIAWLVSQAVLALWLMLGILRPVLLAGSTRLDGHQETPPSHLADRV
jgi:O-antigen/teichoic acid export membrane protein